MAKDRYSSDHTIEVVGDSKTLNIKDNLIVEANIASANIEANFVQTSGIAGNPDLTISGEVTFEGDVTFENAPSLDSASSARFRKISYPGIGFIPEPDAMNDTANLSNYNVHGTGFGWTWSGSDLVNFCHPLNNIPNGSQLLSFTVSFERSNAADSIYFFFLRYQNFDDDLEEVLGVPCKPGFNGELTQSIPVAAVIDYENYFYVMMVTMEAPNDFITFNGVRLDYQTNSVGL
jgi:hypothetical protein